MKKKVSEYEIINQSDTHIECFREENKEIRFIVCSDIIDAEGLVLKENACLGMGVKPYVSIIKINSINNDFNKNINDIEIRTEIYNRRNTLIGENNLPESKFEQNLKPGNELESVIYVSNENSDYKFVDKLEPLFIEEVRVFIY